MKALSLTILLALLLTLTPITAQSENPPTSDRVITVMTMNAYHGVNDEIFAVPTATSYADLLSKVTAVYQGYFARDFPSRAAALAAEVEAGKPDLIGLQEAVLVRTQYPADGAVTPATTIALDYVQILLDAFAARGLAYKVIIQQTGMDAEMPSSLGIDIRHTDREVILARADLDTTEIKLSNIQAGDFSVNCPLSGQVIGTTPIQRGWVAVDVKVRGKGFRFISTHLDGDCLPVTPYFQLEQAKQVLLGPANTSLPVVFVGDLNSPADGTGVTYELLKDAGFADAWVQAGTGYGLTCCHHSDLLNIDSAFDRRIDLILTRGGITALSAEVFGEELGDKTLSGLWPSDHAAVVSRLKLPYP